MRRCVFAAIVKQNSVLQSVDAVCELTIFIPSSPPPLPPSPPPTALPLTILMVER